MRPDRPCCTLARVGLAAEKPRRATRADLEAVPPNQVAEIIHGTLHTFPRPAPAHARTSSRLGVKLGGPFDLGEGGPGGWHILDEPEIHFGPGTEEDILVPDLAGWRVERLPELPQTAYFTLAPDWVCEVLSARTEAIDRIEKMPVYAREGVRHAWLIHPLRQTLEVFVLDSDGRWKLAGLHRGNSRVSAEPFDAIALDLGLLWTGGKVEEADEPPPPSKPKRPPVKARRPPRRK